MTEKYSPYISADDVNCDMRFWEKILSKNIKNSLDLYAKYIYIILSGKTSTEMGFSFSPEKFSVFGLPVLAVVAEEEQMFKCFVSVEVTNEKNIN